MSDARSRSSPTCSGGRESRRYGDPRRRGGRRLRGRTPEHVGIRIGALGRPSGMYERLRIVHKAVMSAGFPIRAYEASRGWWATAVRLLSFVLLLALMAPCAISSADAHRLPDHAPAFATSSHKGAPDQPDGCPACHATCGCHLAIGIEASPGIPIATAGRPSYATADVTVASISAGRLPRPPRA